MHFEIFVRKDDPDYVNVDININTILIAASLNIYISVTKWLKALLKQMIPILAGEGKCWTYVHTIVDVAIQGSYFLTIRIHEYIFIGLVWFSIFST